MRIVTYLTMLLMLVVATNADGVQVRKKPQSVSNTGEKAGRIDYNDADPIAARSITQEEKAYLLIISPLLHPPRGMKFRAFPNNRWVDIMSHPEAVWLTETVADPVTITFSGYFKLENSNGGMFPLQGEGNLEGGEGGKQGGAHWSVKVEKYGVDLDTELDGKLVYDYDDEELELSEGAFIALNSDDDDGNRQRDVDDSIMDK